MSKKPYGGRASALAIAALLTISAVKADVSAFVSLQDQYLNERIAQLAVQTGMTTMKRPYAVAYVRQQLNGIRDKMPGLYREIDRGLSRYEQSLAVTRLQATAASETREDSATLLPNARGEALASEYRVSAAAIAQPFDFMAVQLGALKYDGATKTSPIDSYLVLGGDYFVLDIGYREHWLSPFHNGAMLYSTNARPSVSVGISNPLPIESWWNLQYEIFVTRLERHQQIAVGNTYESGRPAVLGTHISFSPLDGWTLALTRTMQFGGGSREVSASSVWDAFIDPVSNDNDFGDMCEEDNSNCEFGNQQAALSSRVDFSGTTPFSLYFEYAGEDTASASNSQLGNLAVSFGLYIPFMPDAFLGSDWSLRYEYQQWQNSWYRHHIYRDGYTNDGVVLGHWGANQRATDDAVGARSQLLQLGRQLGAHERLETSWRFIRNESYGTVNYKNAQEVSMRYYTRWWQQDFNLALTMGNDVFDNKYSRIEFGWEY